MPELIFWRVMDRDSGNVQVSCRSCWRENGRKDFDCFIEEIEAYLTRKT